MENILEEYPANLESYFSLLEKTGYTKPCDTFRLLIFGFMDEMLNGRYSEFTTEEDRKIINEFVNMASGTCLYPYHKVDTNSVIG